MFEAKVGMTESLREIGTGAEKYFCCHSVRVLLVLGKEVVFRKCWEAFSCAS